MGGASLQDLVAQCLSARHLGFALRLPRKAGDGRHGVGGFPSSVNLWNGSCADEPKAFGPAARTGNPVGHGDETRTVGGFALGRDGSGKFIAFAPIAVGANLGPGLRADRERRVSGECLGGHAGSRPKQASASGAARPACLSASGDSAIFQAAARRRPRRRVGQGLASTGLASR